LFIFLFIQPPVTVQWFLAGWLVRLAGGAGCLFDEDEFLVTGNAPAVFLAFVRNDYFARCTE
jgi:hypothetical protein